MRYDHFTMLPEKAFQPRNGRQSMTLEGGGGGPSRTTVEQSNIPAWLRPQVEAVLGAGMQEYFETELDPETGQYNITGVKPYKPFSEDARDYFAPLNEQQQNVFGEAAGMTTSPLFGDAAGLTGQAGIGSLGYADQAAGTGQRYEQMATDPSSIQAYMSPYLQNVMERQKLAAVEDAQRTNLGANLASARQGTYGGARQALAQSQREAALGKQLGDIEAGGLQSAFEKAQQAQQFGIGAGLQGLQTGIQGLGQAGQMGRSLADIGTAEQEATLRRLGFQGDIGAQQRQYEQDIINQQIQNFALAQEMPFQRLAGYNALLRGYASPTTTTSQYQAQNPANQLAGTAAQLGGVAQGLGMGKKAGGQIRSFAQGGLSDEEDSITDVDAIARMAEGLSIPQLQQSMKNKTVPEYVGMPILQNQINNAERMKAAQMQQMAQAQGGQQQPSIGQGLMAKADALQGIDAVRTGAGGGMVAFNNGGVARFQNQGLVAGEPEITQEMLEEERRRQEMFLGVDPRIAKMKELLSKQGEEGTFDRALRGLQLFTAGTALKQGDPSQLEKYTQGEAARRKAMAENEMKRAELEGADYQQRAGIYKDVTGRERDKAKVAAEQKFKSGESEKDRQNRLAVASIPAKEIQLAQQLMAKDSTLSYLDAVSKASQALSPKDTYTSTRNALTAAAKAASDEMARLELYNADLRELSKKAAAGDKDAQAKYNDVKKGVEKRVFEQFQVEGVNLSSGTLQRSPIAEPPPASTAPPQAAIDALKSNPNLAAQFDQKYGAGAAAKYLGR